MHEEEKRERGGREGGKARENERVGGRSLERNRRREKERKREIERNRTTIIIVKTEYLAGQRRRLCARGGGGDGGSHWGVGERRRRMIQPDAIPGCIGRSQRKRGSAGELWDRGRKKGGGQNRAEEEEEVEDVGEAAGRSRLPLCSL